MYVMVLQEQNGAGGGDVVNAKEFSEHSDVVAFIRRVPSWISSEELGRQVRRSIILDHSSSKQGQSLDMSMSRCPMISMVNGCPTLSTALSTVSYLILFYPILFYFPSLRVKM